MPVLDALAAAVKISGYSREVRHVPLDLKSIADDGSFEGYAALFRRPDLGNDVILPGAFRDTLQTRGTRGIRMLFQHDPAEPIGIWETLAEDRVGLFARGQLLLDVPRARDVHALMRAGAIDGLSIGFRTAKAHRDRPSGTRRIERVDLWEISIVTFPMQPGARITRLTTPRLPRASPHARPPDPAHLVRRCARLASSLRQPSYAKD